MKRGVLLASLIVAASSCAQADATPKGLVPSYLALATALAEERTEPVAALAAELQTSAAQLSGQPGIADVTTGVQQLVPSDITATRRAFERISDGMVAYMRATPETQTANVIVHCPMAFEDRGALWVQPEGKVANPYFGAAMLRCGDKLAWDATLPATPEL